MSRLLDQHVVSAVLLKRWAVQGQLTAFNLRLNTKRSRSPRSEGFITGLLRSDADIFEAKWKQIEDPMPEVFAAVDRGEALDQALTIERLKDFLALHFCRGRTFFEVF